MSDMMKIKHLEDRVQKLEQFAGYAVQKERDELLADMRRLLGFIANADRYGTEKWPLGWNFTLWNELTAKWGDK